MFKFARIGASLLAAVIAQGRTLEVGPGHSYPSIASAYAKAEKGDVIKVYPLKNGAAYEQVAMWVAKPGITFLGAPDKSGERIKISGKGFEYSGASPTPRAIFQFDVGADGCVLEGFELFLAHNSSHNGAGVRIDQANNITIRNCEVHNNDMGTQSNGPIGAAVNQLFENCIYHHNGDPGEPGQNHNFYLGGTSVTLRGCEVYSPLTGHNFKSRAHYNWIEFCYIHDSKNREFDLVDSEDTMVPDSHSVLLGNIIVKDPACENHCVIQFGQDCKKEHDGTLYLVHNTIIATTKSLLIDLTAPKASVHMIENIIDGGGTLLNAHDGADPHNVTAEDNWVNAAFSGPAVAKGNTIGKQKIEFAGRTDFHIKHPPNGIAGGGSDEDNWNLPSPPDAKDAKPSGKTGAEKKSATGSKPSTGSHITHGPAPLKPLTPPGTVKGADLEGPHLLVWEYKSPAQREPRAYSSRPDLGAYSLSK
jgi:TusA-related sulfurtransferase